MTIRDLRELGGLTQVELAERSGVANSLLCRYEQGRQIPSRRNVQRIGSAVGVPLPVIENDLHPAHRRAIAAQWRGEVVAEDPDALVEAVLDSLAAVLRPELQHLVDALREHAAGPWAVNRPPRAADRVGAEELWAELEAASPADRRLLLDETREFRTWPVCELACAASRKAAPDSAERALELAELAVEIADRLPGPDLFRQRMQGLAGLHLGNAQRVAGQQRIASDTLAQALVLWKNGDPADPGLLDEAQALSLEASLHIDQRRPAEALDRLEKALAVDRGGLRPQLLTQRARALEQLGDYEGAVATLREAAPLVASTDRRMQWIVRFNLLGNLCHLRKFDEAPLLLDEVRALADELGNDLDQLRTRWLTGWVAAGQERRDEAIAILEKVRDDFTARKIAYDTSLVILELAALHQEEGRTAEVKELAGRLVWVFHAEGVEREALAALRLFCEAARDETLTAALARQIADFLYRAQHDPELKFER